MKKLLLVLAVLSLGSLASAQTFVFWNSAGTSQLCNFIRITYNSEGVVAGYDDLVACGYAHNSPVVGFDASVPNDGALAHGAGAVLGDAIYDAIDNEYTGLQWTWFMQLKPSKQKNGHFTGPYGWMGVAGTLAGAFLGDNYGYLSEGDPGANATSGTTAGVLKR